MITPTDCHTIIIPICAVSFFIEMTTSTSPLVYIHNKNEVKLTQKKQVSQASNLLWRIGIYSTNARAIPRAIPAAPNTDALAPAIPIASPAPPTT